MSGPRLPAGLDAAAALRAGLAWLLAAGAALLLPAPGGVPAASSPPLLAATLALAGWNAWCAVQAWRWRLRMAVREPWLLPIEQAVRIARDDRQRQWLGRGFDWTPLHAQRMHRLLCASPAQLAPPRWLCALAGLRSGRAPQPAPSAARIIDGVEARPGPLWLPLPALASHTLVFGQTGTGKTRLAELLVASFLARHREAAVFVIDPKGDRDLRAALERACAATGRSHAFLSLQPAFPDDSIRFDPLRNFARTTSIATRIAALLPGQAGGDPFAQFAWGALHRVAEAMVFAGQRPTLVSLRRCLEGDARALLARALAVWASRQAAASPAALPCVAPRPRAARPAARAGRARTVELEPQLAAAVAKYRARTVESPAAREPAIDALLALVLHDPVHFSKMIQNLLPLLAALTAGELAALLSPDAGDDHDPRPVFDARKVIDQRRCLYIGLDALTDATVGAAIGAITLADLAQVAGELFNRGHDHGGGLVPVLVFVDEAAEVVNAPLVQLLNKSRGAGFTLCLAAQTVHDYEARLGSAAAAAMLLGNPGNLIALRTADAQTQRFCTDSLVQTEIEAIGDSRAIGVRAADGGGELSGGIGSRRERREAALFAPEWLGLLPDLHYVARIAGGRMVKGELPRLVVTHAPGAPRAGGSAGR